MQRLVGVIVLGSGRHLRDDDAIQEFDAPAFLEHLRFEQGPELIDGPTMGDRVGSQLH